jgi:hypothetical protein
VTPGPRAATRRLNDYLKIDDAPRDSVELLTSIVETEKWVGNAGSARERAEIWDEKFRTYLRDDLSELNRLGRHCFFAFNSSSETMLQGAAFIESNDSASLKSEKTRRQLFRSYIEALRQLSARQLELVCAGLLNLAGAKFPTVTQYSADRGVDFFGQLGLGAFFLADETFPGWQKQMEAWMVGQAKHYVDGTVSTPALRDLIGSVSMLRSPKADRRAYPNLIIRTCDSVFHILVTTGRLSSEVWREIDNHGAIGIDGEMLAAFLAARGVASSNNSFDGPKFIEWLSTFETFPVIAASQDDEVATNAAAPGI